MDHWTADTRPCLIDNQSGEPFFQKEDPDTGVLVYMSPLYGANWFSERHAKRFLRKIYDQKEGGLFCDVGANHGLYSLGALDKGWEVLAFEPDPRSYEMLDFNLTNSGFTGWEIFNEAIGHGEEATFYMPDNALCSGAELHKIQNAPTRKLVMEPLDMFFQERVPNVIKIDVEGYEEFVLHGINFELDETLILVECHVNQFNQEGSTPVLDWAESRGLDAVKVLYNKVEEPKPKSKGHLALFNPNTFFVDPWTLLE